MMFEQFRWYYNAVLTVVYLHYGNNLAGKRKYSYYTIRDLFREYRYTEEIHDNFLIQDWVRSDHNELPVPEWWKGKVHSRLPRGAIAKFVSSLNSAISNLRSGNTSNFDMKLRCRKTPTDYLNFEDSGYPVFIRRIKSRYWYTNKERRRQTVSFSELASLGRGVEIIYEKETGKYFLHYPVDRDWFPAKDRRNDNQVKSVFGGDRVISLDPGVRKFMVGYDPCGHSIFIGEGAQKELIRLLYQIDKTEKPYRLWKKVKNLVSELHWKSISFLVRNYDVIILPHFKISQMVRGKKLARITKRLLYMFSYHSFKEKLLYKCQEQGKKLVLVDESYTSCTCGVCGTINKTGGKEVYECGKCGLVIDRDVSGSRNIFIKNTTLRLG